MSPTSTKAKGAMASAAETESIIRGLWSKSIPDTLSEYIRIPNQSPHYDRDWAVNGYQEKVVDLYLAWAKNEAPWARAELVKLEGRTPLIFFEIDGTADGADKGKVCLLYGHADKQPPFLPWDEGLDPYQPVLRDGKLYGRGGADDGYAMFAALASIRALREQGVPFPRCVLMVEFSEESGSPDLPAYCEHLQDRIGDVGLVICLDSGAGNYEQLWMTCSLRGVLGGVLTVEILKEGIHSGAASGIVPSSFRIIRQILERLEDSKTGQVTEEAASFLGTTVPEDRLTQVQLAAQELGARVSSEMPWVPGAGPDPAASPEELLLRRTWKPTVSYTGIGGMPSLDAAGNVLRPRTSLALSVRIPPLVDAKAAWRKLKELLERDPPYGAKVTFDRESAADGWNAPALAKWLEESSDKASRTFYDGKPFLCIGEGGTIPFMGMLGAKFPAAQFLVIGVLGPKSNAHGPNEFLHLEYATRLTMCVAHVIADSCPAMKAA